MGDIELRGSLEWLQLRLNWLYQTIMHRKTGGWPLFQSDEIWIYETVGDDRVCPVCLSFEEQNPWNGAEIQHFFPKYMIVSARSGGAYIPPVFLEPNIHDMEEYQYLLGECRCKMRLLYPAQTLEARLHMEKAEALITG